VSELRVIKSAVCCCLLLPGVFVARLNRIRDIFIFILNNINVKIYDSVYDIIYYMIFE